MNTAAPHATSARPGSRPAPRPERPAGPVLTVLLTLVLLSGCTNSQPALPEATRTAEGWTPTSSWASRSAVPTG